MTVYRLTTKKWAHDLMGAGSAILGGRWNSKGVSVLYTSLSPALCLNESLVHISSAPVATVEYLLVTIEISEPFTLTALHESALPKGWDDEPNKIPPQYHNSTQAIGNNFILSNRHLALKVPSAIMPEESNYLINPKHSEFVNVRIRDVRDFIFDDRLF